MESLKLMIKDNLLIQPVTALSYSKWNESFLGSVRALGHAAHCISKPTGLALDSRRCFGCESKESPASCLSRYILRGLSEDPRVPLEPTLV